MENMLAEIFGWIATILFSLMIIPQMIKTIKTKSTKGVSLLLFSIYLIANIIALIYAILINQMPLIIKYEIGIMTTVFYLAIYYNYSKREKI
jgi:MtN3 and saliva related transmembrane protein